MCFANIPIAVRITPQNNYVAGRKFNAATGTDFSTGTGALNGPQSNNGSAKIGPPQFENQGRRDAMNSVPRDDITDGSEPGARETRPRSLPVSCAKSSWTTRDTEGGRTAAAWHCDETVMGLQDTLDLVHLDDASHALADTDARKRRIVERRFFGGSSVDEVAAIMEVSPQTVLLDSRLTKAWLRREMKRGSRARR